MHVMCTSNMQQAFARLGGRISVVFPVEIHTAPAVEIHTAPAHALWNVGLLP